MKVFGIVLILSFILATSSQGPTFEQFFDAVLKALLTQKGDMIDPLPIEDQQVILTPNALKFLPSFVKPEVDLKDIQLKGLKTLHRSGAAMQSLNINNNKLTVAELAISPLEVDTKVYFNFLGLFIGREAVVTASNFDFFVEFEANKTHKTILVPRFEVKEMKDLEIKLTGSRITDKFTNRIMHHAVPLLKKRIVEAVEKAVQEVLESKVNELPDSMKNILY
jgi:hypothetical protein